MYVVTADQIRSRTGMDLVPAALQALGQVEPGPVRAFERTAGDEIQGVADNPDTVVRLVERLIRAGCWRIGIGVGPVELPLPPTTRAGRGAAFRAARSAIEAAHPRPGQLAVRLGSDPDLTAADQLRRGRHAEYAEGALLLLARLLRGRSAQGWEVVDLLAEGVTQNEAAVKLGVSASAVSQRVRRAAWEEQCQGARLVAHHLSVADGRPDRDEGSGDDGDTGAAGRSHAAVGHPRGLPRRTVDHVGVRSSGPS